MTANIFTYAFNKYIKYAIILVFVALYFSLNNYYEWSYSVIGINALNLAFFTGVLYSVMFKPQSFYNRKRLIAIIFFYSLFFVTIYNTFFYLFSGTFFSTAASDSLFYHNSSIKMSELGLSEGIDYFFIENTFEDLGAVLYMSTLYRLIPNPLIINAGNIVLGLIIAANLFSIASNFMQKKYAFFATLSFSASSFMVYFQSTGLKEVVFVTLIVVCVNYYYNYMYNKGKYSLYKLFAFVAMLLLFRPAVMGMLSLAMFSGYMLRNKNNKNTIIIVGVIMVVALIVISQMQSTVDRYLPSVDTISSRKDSSIQGGSGFGFFVSVLSAFIGPFPTIYPIIFREQVAFYSIGLIFRLFFSIYFIFSLIYIFINKKTQLYAIAAFTIVEMLSLVIILEVFELRLNMPHYPFIFILTFYFLNELNSGKIKKYKVKRIIKYTQIWFIVAFLLVIGWNLRS